MDNFMVNHDFWWLHVSFSLGGELEFFFSLNLPKAPAMHMRVYCALCVLSLPLLKDQAKTAWFQTLIPDAACSIVP